MCVFLRINPRTYKQSHALTVQWHNGGGGVDESPWVFDMLQYFEKILPLLESRLCALQDKVYVIECGAANRPSKVQQGRSSTRSERKHV